MQGPGAGGGDSELVSRQLQLEQKLYYLDLKDNARGRFLKISERTNSSRSTIIVPLNGIVWFVDLFNYYANGDEAELSSKELQLETKVFYFDVGENPRGRYLKVSEAQVPRSNFNRSSIIVPAGQNRDEGWAAFRNILVEIHEASVALPPHPAQSAPVMGVGPGLPGTAPSVGPVGPGLGTAPAAPAAVPSISKVTAQVGGLSLGGGTAAAGNGTVGAGAAGQAGATTASRIIRAEQKKFFLDLGANARGHFLKISEVQNNVRSAIIMPAAAMEDLHEAIGQFLETLRKQGGGGLQQVHVRSIPSLPNKSADGEAIGN